MKTARVLLGALVVVAAIALVGCSGAAKVSAEDKAAATEAVNAMGGVKSAVETGVNYTDYSSRVLDAAAAIEAYQPADVEGTAIRDSLQEALLYYKAAGEVWNEKITGDYTWVRPEVYAEWKAQYPQLEGTVKSNTYYPDKKYVDLDEIMQSAWSVAGNAYASAKSSAASYGE